MFEKRVKFTANRFPLLHLVVHLCFLDLASLCYILTIFGFYCLPGVLPALYTLTLHLPKL